MSIKIRSLEELPEILSAQLIANYLGISRSTVYTLFQTKPQFGGIPNFEVGNSKRADKKDFINWIESRKQEKKEKVY
ncbi:helix-turn-helix domain-containing protein [Paenibacillus polymyxa]|uniref:helix-turn-helix domain-containing protein n=1 Tax=Paenibacillus polymyxa TaxID=1406 RepID=UPI0003D335DD|nr:helix-turn-helix domain-containing protein [Paenibacillus polymyxa]